MGVYLLDTTTLTLHQRGHPRIDAAVVAHSAGVLAITTINVEEVFGGWFARLRRAKTNSQLALASASLAAAAAYLARFQVFPITEPALDRFDQLVTLKLNVGNMDLKIAAVALELGATVVTNNVQDFGRVPGLLWEDWSV